VVVNCAYFLSASYGLLYSTIIPKLETAMALVPVLVIPFMLLGGFFIDLDKFHDVRVIFYPIMYLSPFKYGFQAIMRALDQPETFTPFALADNIYIMIGLGLGIRLVALVAMQIVSTPRRPKLNPIENPDVPQEVNSTTKGLI
jgi:ABC-type multidrug transport system permease subunit